MWRARSSLLAVDAELAVPSDDTDDVSIPVESAQTSKETDNNMG